MLIQLASDGARTDAHSTGLQLTRRLPGYARHAAGNISVSSNLVVYWHTRTSRALTMPTNHMRRARRRTDFWKIIYR